MTAIKDWLSYLDEEDPIDPLHRMFKEGELVDEAARIFREMVA